MKIARLMIPALIAASTIPVPAMAADAKLTVGWSAIAVGSGMVFGAFDYDSSCPAGYTTHTFENLPTQCVHVDKYGSDVRSQPTTATYERPGLLKAGIATAAAGVVVLILPRRAQRVVKAVDVAVTRSGWHASKTIEWWSR